MPPIGYPGNSVSKAARAKAGGGFESAIEVAPIPDSVTIGGSGFGAEPNVVLWRTFDEGSDGAQLQSSAPTGEVGTIQDVSATDQYTSHLGRKVFKGWQSDTRQGLSFVNASDFNRYRCCYATAVPTGSYFPGADVLESTAGANQVSIWKLTWMMKGDSGNNDSSAPDSCVPTVVAQNFAYGGNSTDGSDTRFIGTGNSAGGQFSWNRFNTFSFVSEPDITNPATINGTMRLTHCGDLGVSELVRTDVPVMLKTAPATYTDSTAFFDRWKINPWADEVAGFPAQAYFSDLYLATESSPGANDFVQCAFLGDAAVYENCTELRPVKASAWSDTEITIPNPYGLPYYHIVKPDGSVVSGATT